MIADFNIMSDQLFRYRIIYQMMIALQEIFLLLYCFIKSNIIQQKIAGVFLLLSLTLRISSSIVLIRQQCQNKSIKYSTSNQDSRQSKSNSIDKHSPHLNADRLKINLKGGSQQTMDERKINYKIVIKQLVTLLPQIVAKLSLFNAMLYAQNINLILFLNYFYDEKTFIFIGTRRLVEINQLIMNAMNKFIPFSIVIIRYMKESSQQNGERGYTMREDDLVWIGLIVLFYFFSDQFYFNATQKLHSNDSPINYIHSLLKQNSAPIIDIFLNNNIQGFQYQNQADVFPSIENRNNQKLSQFGNNSQIGSNLINRSPNVKRSQMIAKKNKSIISKSGITLGDMPLELQNANSFESSLNDIQDQLFFQDIIGLVPQGLAIINAENKVLFTNSKILELLECDKDSVLNVIKSLSTQTNTSNHNGSIYASNPQYSKKPSNNVNPQPSYKHTRPSFSQFVSKKPESSIENILSSPFANEEQGIQMSKLSQFNNIANSMNCSNLNLHAPSSSIRNMNSSKQNSPKLNDNSQILDRLQEDGLGEQFHNSDNTQLQGDSKKQGAFEDEILNNEVSQKRSHSNSSPHCSNGSIDIQDYKNKQSTGKFGCSTSDIVLDTFTGNLRKSKQQNNHKKNQSYNVQQNSNNCKNSQQKSNNQYKQVKQKMQKESKGQNSLDNSPPSESDKIDLKHNNVCSKNNLIQCNDNNDQSGFGGVIKRVMAENEVNDTFINDSRLPLHQGQHNNNNNNNNNNSNNKQQSDFLMIGDIYQNEDKSFNNGQAMHSTQMNQNSNNIYDDQIHTQNNITVSKNDLENKTYDNIIIHSDNQFVSFHKQDKVSPSSSIDKIKLKEEEEAKINKNSVKFEKQLPSSVNANNKVNNHQNNLIIDLIVEEDMDKNVAEHNHILKKEITKQNSIFTPQLKQRKIKVGQLISNMFDNGVNTVDDLRTAYGGVKKANSKNHLITQLSEAFESNYSRNHSLLGQINGNRNIGFYQYKNNEASMQVVYKGKSLVVRLIPCQYQTDLEDNDSPQPQNQSLVLIQVEPFWDELFQAKIDDFSKNKMQLFGSLCHELRTPLNCSISFLDLFKQLKEGTDQQEDVNEFIEPSLRSNQLMLNMVNDILDFVQMADNKFKFNPIQFNLIELIEECLILIRVHADIKNINLKIRYNESVPTIIVSDPNRIRQIILNFLSNSLKFTKKGGTIQVGADGIDSSIISATKVSSVIRISVHDSGIGISKQNIRKIFEVFNKTDHKDSSINPNGCGIGLPLSNSLAKLIGPSHTVLGVNSNGQQIQINSGIQVESVEGQGSIFSFLIQDLNTKLPKIRDQRESCEISEQPDTEQVQAQHDHLTLKSAFQDGQHIPHLKIAQEVAGGLQMNHFQQAQANKFSYLVEQSSDFRMRSFQSSMYRSSNINSDNNASDRAQMNVPSKSQRRITEGHRKSTNSEQSDQCIRQSSLQQAISLKKGQTQQPSYPTQSNFVIVEANGHNSPINIIRSSNKSNSSMIQAEIKQSNKSNSSSLIQPEMKSDLKSLQVISITNNLSSFPQIRNMNSQSIQSSITYNTQDLDNQSLALPQIIQLQPHVLCSLPQPASQNIISQPASQNIAIPPQIIQPQIQKCLLDANNFSLNSRGEETKILIADDSGFNIMVLKKIIQLFHIQNISICHDGQEAVTKVRDILNDYKERLFDIIFMDLDMPNMNGYEACKQIKQMIHNYDLPDTLSVVACSAYGMEVKDEHTFHISQMDDAIVKPVKKNQILNIFQTFLRDKPKPFN